MTDWLTWQCWDLENSDHLQFGPVVSLENSDCLFENSDHSWRTRPVRLENSDYYVILSFLKKLHVRFEEN